MTTPQWQCVLGQIEIIFEHKDISQLNMENSVMQEFEGMKIHELGKLNETASM